MFEAHKWQSATKYPSESQFKSSFAGLQYIMQYYTFTTLDCCQDLISVEAIEREVLRGKWWIVVMDMDCIQLSPARFSGPLLLAEFSFALGTKRKRPYYPPYSFSPYNRYVSLSAIPVTMKVIVKKRVLNSFSIAFVK